MTEEDWGRVEIATPGAGPRVKGGDNRRGREKIFSSLSSTPRPLPLSRPYTFPFLGIQYDCFKMADTLTLL